MPLGTVYNIETRYRVDADKAKREVRGLAGRMDRLSESAQRSRDRLMGLWDSFKMGAGIIAGGGLALATRHMFKLGMAAEDAKISIAGIFSTVGDESKTFAQNMSRAEGLFDKFGEASIKSPFDRSAFQQLFGSAAPALASEQLGLMDQQITSLTSRAVMAGKIFNQGDQEQTGRDIVQMLQGRAGTDTKTFAALRGELFEELRVASTEAFNKIAKSDPTRIFEAIDGSLKSLDPALDAYANSFEGLFGTIKEFVNRGFLDAWGAFKGEVKDDLKAVANYLQTHEDEIRDFGRSAGKFLGDAFERIGGMAAFAARNIEVFVAAAGGLAAVKGVGFGMDMAEMAGLASFGEKGGVGHLWDKLKGSSLSKAAAGGGSYSKALVAAPDFASIGGTGMKATLGGYWTTLAGSFSGLVSAAGPLVGILLPLTAILGGIAGTFRILTSDMDELGDRASGAKMLFNDAVSSLMVSLDSLAMKFGSDGITSLIVDFVEFMGSGFVGVITLAIEAVNLFVMALDGFAAIFVGIGNTFAELWLQFQAGRKRAAVLGDEDSAVAILGGLKSLDFGDAAFKGFDSAAQGFMDDRKLAETGRAPDIAAAAKKHADSTKDPKNQGNAQINVTNHITQHVRTNADPDRIALRAADVIGRKTRHSIRPFAPGL